MFTRGEVVRIKSLEDIKMEFRQTADGWDSRHGLLFNKRMAWMCGQEITVKDTELGGAQFLVWDDDLQRHWHVNEDMCVRVDDEEISSDMQSFLGSFGGAYE